MNKEKIYQLLNSDFERKLFEAALTNLKDRENPLRYNNFAYSIRELSRHILHRLAPGAELIKCSWFDTDINDGKATRAQRAKFAIQGGFSDTTLSNLGLDIDAYKESVSKIIKAINSLSKYTHVNEGTFGMVIEKVDETSELVINSFIEYTNSIEECKEIINGLLDSRIDNDLINTVITNSYQNIQMIAPRFSLQFHDLGGYNVKQITVAEVVVNVHGKIHVTLEYGSRQERREGDGLDINEAFPFEVEIRYPITENFPPVKYQISEFDVNTDSWYGESE